MKLLVTGAAGFIGSTYVRLVKDDHDIVVLDKLTYAGRRENLPEDVELVVGSIEDRALVSELAEGVDAIVNFAAESHVDRSIADQDAFARTHVIGTSVLLECARRHGVQRFIQISTDEVYGSLGATGRFTEQSPLDPSSPYSASKAGADLLVLASHKTYGQDVLVTRCSNNYGPYQFPEKLIPLMIIKALRDEPLPVYGDGMNVRDWIHVDDHCAAIVAAVFEGKSGTVYNFGGHSEMVNLDLVRMILDRLGKPHSLISFVPDRLGHDRRYAIDSSFARRELDWKPLSTFKHGLDETIQWYIDNPSWWQPLLERTGRY